MKQTITNSRSNEKGFTLVELAIVMIIIGLLIGGILKGQELITNAQVANAVAQTKGIDAGVSTFKDSYRAFPGDMANASTRLPNCPAGSACASDGDGDSKLDIAPDVAITASDEAQIFFVHLAAADLITGVQNVSNIILGEGLPATSLGGGFTVGFTNGGTLGQSSTARGGHWLSFREGAAAPTAGNGPLSANQAFRIDQKMDDGAPTTGAVVSNDATSCTNGASPEAYDEQNNPVGCALYIRIQG